VSAAVTVRLTGGRVLDPIAGTLERRDLALDQGRIVPLDALGQAPVVDVGDRILAPGFVDLHAALVHAERDGVAAARGGFTTVLASPDHPTVLDRADAVEALVARSRAACCRVLPVGALTRGLHGQDLAEVGLLAGAGCVAVGQGACALGSPRVLRHALEYAARLDVPVFLRGAEPQLEESGVAAEGPRSIRLGLPGVPAISEEIGIHRLAALARLTGARVHVTHVWTAAGVQALRRVRAEGARLTASTTAYHLALDPDACELSPYDGHLRFVPPLGAARDREALAQAVIEGVIDGVASDHRPWPAHAKEGTLEEARAGSVGLDAAFSLTLHALHGDLVAVVRALASGPDRVLGRTERRLAPGEPADVVLLDPAAPTLLDRPAGAHPNTPLAGARLDGQVVATWVEGVRTHGSVGSEPDIG